MAKGGFVVNWDGKRERCHQFKADYDNYGIIFNDSGIYMEIKDWSTLSVHAVTKKDAEEIVLEPEEYIGTVKGAKVKEVKKDEKKPID